MEELKAGDVVEMNSQKNGQLMTVEEVKMTTAKVAWFDDSQALHRDSFPMAMLKKVR